MRRKQLRSGMLTAALTLIMGGTISAEMIEVDTMFKSPSFMTLPLGTETPGWVWSKGSPYVDGYYTSESRDSFYLEGNGHSIYQCWDEAGFAFVDTTPLTGDFQLTARFADLPEQGPGSVGLTLKASLQAHTPVLDLRWDYFYPERQNNPNGLRWFNRITESSRIGFCDACEAGLCQGTDCHPSCVSQPDDETCWQGCLNMGFENFADPEGGFTDRNGIWVRVRREGVKFYLYATYDTTEWKEIQPITNTGTPLGYFRVPELDSATNLVFAGFTVVGVEQGGHIQTATFDNISLEVYSYKNLEVSVTKRTGHALTGPKLVGSTVKIPAGSEILKAEYFGAQGRKLGQLVREGDNYVIPDSRSLSAGIYLIRVQLRDRTVAFPYMKN